MASTLLHQDASAALAEGGRFDAVQSGLERLTVDPALVRAWESLEAAGTLPTQSHAFTEALAATLPAGSVTQVLAVAGAAGIAALLPLCRASGPFARWRMVGAREVFEPGDALAASDAAMLALARSIARQPRALACDRLLSDSRLIPALRQAMKRRGLVSVRPGTGCPTIALDGSWQTPEARFNSGRRSDFRRAARRAGEFGEVRYELLAPAPAEFDALFDEAIGVELASWKREAGTAIASDSAKERFFRRYFRAACEAGTFRVAFLRIDGRAVAMQMAVETLGRYWLFKIGYDERYGKCSPGTLLMLHAIGEAARRGLVAFELLGNVEPWIAELWTREQHDCVRLRTYPFNLHGAVALANDGLAWLKAWSGAKFARAGG